MKSRVDQILAMDLAGEDGDDISFANADSAISSPYLTYGNEAVAGAVGGPGGDRGPGGGGADRDDRSVRGDKSTGR